MAELRRYPGYWAAWGSTSGWADPPGPFVWCRYSQPNAEGVSAYERGFVATRVEAKRQALVETGAAHGRRS